VVDQPRGTRSSDGGDRERYDVIVIGGGQAGLAIGYYLRRQGRRFAILEAADAVGTAWRGRWDSLVLFTPRRYSALPGLIFRGDPDAYPTRDEVVAYLEEYARKFELPVHFDSRVRSLRQHDRGFVVQVGDRGFEADQVVVATGPFQVPRIPEQASGLAPDVSRRTARRTSNRTTSLPAASSSWAAATRGTRSRTSSRRRAT
jgi:putative flavoprotein involved in K+ transport